MMRDENRVKKCEKYLILLNKLAGVVQWQNGSFPSCTRGCMGRQDEVDPHVIDGLTLMRAFVTRRTGEKSLSLPPLSRAPRLRL
jgi:hypothetical protein